MKHINRLLNNAMTNEGILYYQNRFDDINSELTDRPGTVGLIARDIASAENSKIKSNISYIDVGETSGFLKYTDFEKVDYVMNSHASPDASNLSNFKFSPIKIGKFINTVLPNQYKADEIEKYVKSFNNIIDGNVEHFQVLSGEDIRKYYNFNEYYSTRGTMANSCMRFPECGPYLDILVANPGVCKMLALFDTDSGLIMARALLWTVVGDSRFDILMDRIYFTDISNVSKFRKYATDNGYAYKTNDTHSESKVITINDKSEYLTVQVNLENNGNPNVRYHFEKFPYLDTFSRYDFINGILYNDTNMEIINSVVLLSEFGWVSNEGNETVYSKYLDKNIRMSKSIWSEPVDSYIKKSSAIEITKGSKSNHGWYPEGFEDLVNDESLEDFIHKEDAIHSEYLGGYILAETAIVVITDLEPDGSIQATSEINKKDTYLYTNIEKIGNPKWLKPIMKKWNKYPDYENCEGIINDLLEDIDGVKQLKLNVITTYGYDDISREDHIIFDEKFTSSQYIDYYTVAHYIQHVCEFRNITQANYLDLIDTKIKYLQNLTDNQLSLDLDGYVPNVSIGKDILILELYLSKIKNALK